MASDPGEQKVKFMKKRLIILGVMMFASSYAATAQTRTPSSPKTPFVVKSKQQVADITAMLQKKTGNVVEEVVPQSGLQTRIAIFQDKDRVNDLHEVHDGSDDIYYVTNGTATLMLGGSLVEPNEISPGEWRAKSSAGGQKVVIKKGDVIFVPRGTPHQRTVTDKKFSMILIKIFSQNQPAK